MEIATLLSVHDHPNVIKDTLDSIRTWMTKDVLMIVDGAAWNKISQCNFDAYLLEGFWHNYNRSPYRNIMLGFWELSKKFPKADWYCYMEYDCLVASNDFIQELEYADSNGIWCLGSDPRRYNLDLPFLETILGDPIKNSHYLLGCCVFYNGEFIRQINWFFEKFLNYTNGFTKGFFPGFEEYDLAEHLLPTMVKHYGGKIGGLSEWSEVQNKWTRGDYKKFPIRFRPEIDAKENYDQAAIFHPIKNYDHPIREHHRSIRCKMNTEISKTI